MSDIIVFPAALGGVSEQCEVTLVVMKKHAHAVSPCCQRCCSRLQAFFGRPIIYDASTLKVVVILGLLCVRNHHELTSALGTAVFFSDSSSPQSFSPIVGLKACVCVNFSANFKDLRCDAQRNFPLVLIADWACNPVSSRIAEIK